MSNTLMLFLSTYCSYWVSFFRFFLLPGASPATHVSSFLSAPIPPDNPEYKTGPLSTHSASICFFRIAASWQSTFGSGWIPPALYPYQSRYFCLANCLPWKMGTYNLSWSSSCEKPWPVLPSWPSSAWQALPVGFVCFWLSLTYIRRLHRWPGLSLLAPARSCH